MIVKEHFHIASDLWYKIGGEVRFFLECKTREDIIDAITFIKEKNIERVFVCGTGSNLIFTDDYFDGAVIHISSPRYSGLSRISYSSNVFTDSGVVVPPPQNDEINIDQNGNIEAFAGVLLDDVIQFGFSHNLIGLEWAGGLPGTVGAAIRGNVGAYGGEIKDVLVSADVLDFSEDTPVVKTLVNEDLAFAYRSSLVKTHKKMIVLAARFRLQEANSAEMEAARDVYAKRIQQRKDNHPLEYPNCGSVFKNLRDAQQIEKVLSVYPELRENVETKWHGKMAVASVIEKLGLKGFRVGDAQVSEKHALFIVNLGHARSKDVLAVIDTIQNKFQEAFGFDLELEVELVL